MRKFKPADTLLLLALLVGVAVPFLQADQGTISQKLERVVFSLSHQVTPPGSKEWLSSSTTATVITRLESTSLIYGLQSRVGPVPYSGEIRGSLVDGDGKKLTNFIQVAVTASDHGDRLLSSGIRFSQEQVSWRKGEVRFLGEVRFEGVRPLPLHFVIPPSMY